MIEKKCWPEYFEKILSGAKTFELRLADFECNINDTLLLREWDPETSSYTGRTLTRKITHMLKTKDIEFWSKKAIKEHGYLVLSLQEEHDCTGCADYTDTKHEWPCVWSHCRKHPATENLFKEK